jgi:hypothetical protein
MKKNRSIWPTIVGIIGLFIGIFGVLNGYQGIYFSSMISMKEDVFSNIEQSSLEKQTKNELEKTDEYYLRENYGESLSPEIINKLKANDNLPSWTKSWTYFSGIAKIVISILYLIVSIMILRRKSSSILLFYWVAGASSLFSILNGVAIISTSSFISLALILWSQFGVIINIALIVVVARGNKEDFKIEPFQQA